MRDRFQARIITAYQCSELERLDEPENRLRHPKVAFQRSK